MPLPGGVDGHRAALDRPNGFASRNARGLDGAAKRGFDLVAALAGLVCLAPILIGIAILVRLDSPGPALFRQVRVGRYGRLFTIYKFRSMFVSNRRGSALTTSGDVRISRIGGVLRRTKLDELPQLINILRGDMSLVGPRPEVEEFMKLYTEEQRQMILSMRPGMTDYASIIFRNESEILGSSENSTELYEEKIMPAKYHLYMRYRKDMGPWNDLKIILATVAVIFSDSVPKFLGLGTVDSHQIMRDPRLIDARRE